MWFPFDNSHFHMKDLWPGFKIKFHKMVLHWSDCCHFLMIWVVITIKCQGMDRKGTRAKIWDKKLLFTRTYAKNIVVLRDSTTSWKWPSVTLLSSFGHVSILTVFQKIQNGGQPIWWALKAKSALNSGWVRESNSTLFLNIGLGVQELCEWMRYQLRHVGGAIELGLGTWEWVQ